MSGETQLMLTFAGVHIVGLLCIAALIVPALRSGPASRFDPPDQGSDEGGGNDRRRPQGPSDVPGGGIPLPDAVPARVRLREPARLAELLPRHQRRPAREPDREPVRSGRRRV
jgi:hypothetical protein